MQTAKLLEAILPADRIKAKLIDLAAYAPDAGFYYLRPKAVVQPVSEDEIVALFRFSQQHSVPLTFRTGGTSLSGQAITDGVLVDLSRYWKGISVEEGGDHVRVQPGVIGAVANAHLKRHKRKIGPDPASINSAMMGGILSNNASGMCCGVTRNSYHTTKYIRFILPNGKAFSTEQPGDYTRFAEECPDIYNRILQLRETIHSKPHLHDTIRRKYKTKNTVGYSVNAFIDHEHPLDILAHLLIGAEGTLGFISEAVLQTIPDYPAKSTALLYFPSIYAACAAIEPLRITGAEAAELMDRSSLRSIEHIKGLPEVIRTLPEGAAALLVEYQADNSIELKVKTDHFFAVAKDLSLLYEPRFTENPAEQALLWKVRKGMFPSVGAVRASGTTVILEDIALPIEKLGDGIVQLQELFKKYGYDNAIIFGHAKDGNIHFVVTQTLNVESEVARYDQFLKEVVHLVVNQYGGALKAEHGTGRNMAPFVETEWGTEIYEVMRSLKQVVDPHNLLNPGVIINDDQNAHIRNLKDLPQVEEEVDKCMECGFCEHRCPSRELTLTPRQRIVVRRELSIMKDKGKKKEYRTLLDQYQYSGMDTCAVDGLCATVCPVEINTGALIKRLRRESHSPTGNKVALLIARHFRTVTVLVHAALKTGTAFNAVFGANAMRNLTGTVKKVIPAFPLWSNTLRPTSGSLKGPTQVALGRGGAIVYFPTCISRVMGGHDKKKESTMDVFYRISEKAGIRVILPKEIKGMCCGQPFSSKGFYDAFKYTANDTIEKLWATTEEGKYPVVLDITSCTHTLHMCRPALTEENKKRFDAIRIIDSVDYVADYVVPQIPQFRKKSKVVLHPVCSLHHMGLEQKFLSVARQLAEEVVVPMHAGCCGMAGDRGFLVPELTQSATRPEAEEVRATVSDGYYSSSKTCEMALSEAVGVNYESILNLVDECIGLEEAVAKQPELSSVDVI
jgi:D-lactate dehydrogenase